MGAFLPSSATARLALKEVILLAMVSFIIFLINSVPLDGA
jgi:hypothetical protein